MAADMDKPPSGLPAGTTDAELRELALGHLRSKQLPEPSKTIPEVLVDDPDSRDPRLQWLKRISLCGVCSGQIAYPGIWVRLEFERDKKIDVHYERCFQAWLDAARDVYGISAQRPPGFTEYTLIRSYDQGPLTFQGRILARAQGERESGTLRYVLYETSDNDFVGEATVVGRFTMAQRFETQERACAWFGDETLKAALLRQLDQ